MTVRYSVKKESVDDEVIYCQRTGDTITFSRGKEKEIIMHTNRCISFGYEDISDFLDDLSVMARIDSEETNDS